MHERGGTRATMSVMQEETHPPYLLWATVGLIVLAIVGGSLYSYYLASHTLNEVSASAIAETKVASEKIKQLEEENVILTASTTALVSELARKKTDNFDLLERLALFETNNSSLQEQVARMAGELGIYDKLSKTDRELLQKYSKIYFLNENYAPSSLATITPKLLFRKNRPLLIHSSVLPELTLLLEAASSSNESLLVVSAYRSFGAQASLKSNYLMTYGHGANRFSAEQGYSEHQLGTTIDFTTPSLATSFTKIESTSAFVWLTQNAYRYGFVLSYPKNNGYYQYEPWHWRFVGMTLATKLHNEGRYFYDIPQREIDTFLVSIFDAVPTLK